MRTAALALSLVAFSIAASGQKFSLLPQAGFESSKTKINYNDLTTFSPLGNEYAPQLGLRLNYASKQGHGFFVGAASSRNIVLLSFNNPAAALNNFTAASGDVQLRLEGGYQYSSPRINLGKAKQSTSNKQSSNKTSTTSTYKSHCYYSCQSRCGSNKSKTDKAAPSKAASTWLKIQPSVGMSWIPGVPGDVISKTTAGTSAYEYRAGNYNTAFLTGVNFELGKGNKGLFTLGVNYFSGIGNLDKQSITTVEGTKSTTTTFQSQVSGWNLRLGIPIALGKSSASKAKSAESKPKPQYKPQNRCGQYRVYYRCGRAI